MQEIKRQQKALLLCSDEGKAVSVLNYKQDHEDLEGEEVLLNIWRLASHPATSVSWPATALSGGTLVTATWRVFRRHSCKYSEKEVAGSQQGVVFQLAKCPGWEERQTAFHYKKKGLYETLHRALGSGGYPGMVKSDIKRIRDVEFSMSGTCIG